MDAWIIWILIACAFGVGEIMTTSFFLAPFGVGALAGAVAAGAGLGAVPAFAVFIVISLLMLLFVRPVARAHLHTPIQIRTGTAALVGRRAIVLERISNSDDLGSIKLDGEVWTARAYDDDEVYDVGRPVTVIEIKGATALVAQ